MAYTPSPFTGDITLDNLLTYIEEELLIISRSFTEFDQVQLRPLNVAVAKPREGMVVYADGTNWNPGGGKGVYVYTGGAWSKL